MRKQKGKRTGIIIAILVCIVIIYVCIAYYFSKHYYFHTTINGLPSGGKNSEQVSTALDEELKKYKLHIIGREKLSEYITAEDVDASAQWSDELEQIISEQKSILWPIYIGKGKEYELDFSIKIDEERLEIKLDGMDFLKGENMKKPQNAYIGDYNEVDNCYEIVQEYPGTFLSKKKVYEAVKRSIISMVHQLDIEEIDCYYKPTVSSEDKRLQTTWKTMNQMVSAEIKYQFADKTEVLDGSIIHEWIFRENYGVMLDEAKVAEYVKQLAKKYDTAFRRHPFITAQGQSIVIESGTYGWWMDRGTETLELAELIKQGNKIEREPVYFQRAVAYGEKDYGDTYVEIDLSKQHLYLWVEKELVLESDFVSGSIKNGYATPAGIFPITYKERNATLNGTGYSSKVSFWMPFNGGVGMHDAPWRKEFGGKIYEYNGSHGCINLPYKVAEKIYEYSYAGMPVICYYDIGDVETENALEE